MSTDFDEISASIIEERKRIQQNQQERNKRFNQCLQSYLNHLKQETQQLDATQDQNDARNQLISSAFQNVYERIMTSSQVALRKVKETCFEKKDFWEKLIQNNADLTDLELKKDLYVQKRDAVERYQDSIQSQKVKKIPYELLLGKLKQKQTLKQWQDNNKKLEEEVAKGTKTLKEWNMEDNRQVGRGTYARGTWSNESEHFINQFATQPESGPWNRAPLKQSGYQKEEGSILSNFQYRRP